MARMPLPRCAGGSWRWSQQCGEAMGRRDEGGEDVDVGRGQRRSR